jgi:pyruvate dehydrogenase E1 component alpha subunit
LGDGAFEEGVVYETLNLAGLFKLPLLLVVENNLFSVNSPLADRRARGHDSKTIVEGFGAKYAQADGNNYRDVAKKASALVRHLRGGAGPAVLECITYRHMAHSAPIFDESCRAEDVAEVRKAKDSVARLRRELIKSGISEKTLARTEKNIEQGVEKDLAYAVAAPLPKKETLFTDLYV